MMPPGHIAVTWGVARLCSTPRPLDYRLLALAALWPDVIDKPLAIWVFPYSNSTQNIGHSLLVHVALLLGGLLFTPKVLPYILAFNGHLIADRMWLHTETFWWPLYGWQVFWAYKFMNSPAAMLQVYLDIITNYPHIWLIELIALGGLVTLAYQQRWYKYQPLKQFLQTGYIP